MASAMARIFARAIKRGDKTIDDVPTRWKEETRKILKEEYSIEV